MNNLLSFSTLGCPEWSIETIIERAAEFGYKAIEWRGGPEGHVNPHLPAADRTRLRRLMDEAGLSSLSVTTYTSFVSPDPALNQANLDDLKQHMELAADLGASYTRVWFGEITPGIPMASTYPWIAANIEAAATHSRKLGVKLAIEPHDDFMPFHTVLPILDQISGPEVGILWDVANSVAVGDDVAEAYKALSARLFYIHVKDGLGHWPDWQPTPIGQGKVPWLWVFSTGYSGPYSVEWERAWHPELEPADPALLTARKTIEQLMNSVERAQRNLGAPQLERMKTQNS